ncbi:AraC family transcriptional regulator [Nocardiopsis rhodophaea]|uniref:AraC family transcriptional regulator n=1 Tax=Nocardiopsis rhodophaea TaxID=280238 RepID=UPI0031CF35D0
MLDTTVTIDCVRVVLWGARRRGVDAVPLLAGAGVPPSLLDAEGARVPADRFAVLVRAVCVALDDEFLGLADDAVRPGTFAMMCRTAIHCPDLGAALRRAGSFYALFPGAPRGWLSRDPAKPEARWEFSVHMPPRSGPFIELCLLGITLRLASWAIGRRLRPSLVELAHSRAAAVADHRFVLGERIRYERARPALVIGAADLAAPIVRDEHDLRSLLTGSPAGLLAGLRPAVATSERVRHILDRDIAGGVPAAHEVAARLNMSPQTLRRHLRAEGVSFREIRDRVLRDAAVSALADGGWSVAEVAEHLGFSEASAFQRAFKRWAGTTPGAYRSARCSPPPCAGGARGEHRATAAEHVEAPTLTRPPA